MTLTRFEYLECWREARSLVRKVYAATWDGAFNLKAAIMQQLAYIREWGGEFVTAVPKLRIAS